MSRNYYFGKAFAYQFAVYSNELGEFEDLSGVTDSPTCYVYDFKPSRTQAINGTGSPLETINSWADDATTNGKVITIPALTDPNPEDARQVHEYWLAVNYNRVNSGDSILELRMLPIERPLATGEPANVGLVDLQNVFSDVDSYASDAEQVTKISLAKSLIASDLGKDGYEWANLFEPNDLSLCVSYRAVSLIMLETRFGDNQEFIERADRYEANAETLLKSLRTRFDIDKDGSPEVIDPNDEIEGATNVVMLGR